MPIERCEGCPVVGIEHKCFALGKLAGMARKTFEDDGKTAKTYEVECRDLYMFQRRNTEISPSREPMDDLREMDWEAKVAKGSVTSITTEGELIRKAQILDWRARVVAAMAAFMDK